PHFNAGVNMPADLSVRFLSWMVASSLFAFPCLIGQNFEQRKELLRCMLCLITIWGYPIMPILQMVKHTTSTLPETILFLQNQSLWWIVPTWTSNGLIIWTATGSHLSPG